MIGSGPVISTDQPIYLDANILIYAMETDGDGGMLARRWLMQVDRGRLRAVTSELTITEVLPHPIASGKITLLDGYKRLLQSGPNLHVSPVSRAVLERAADVRAHLKSETPDAIHVATALIEGCGGFLTNDERLKLPADLPRLSLADVMTLY